jgi:hypothetical protein
LAIARAQRQHPAVLVQRELGSRDVIARMGVGEEALGVHLTGLRSLPAAQATSTCSG